jgi:hypothetical protein
MTLAVASAKILDFPYLVGNDDAVDIDPGERRLAPSRPERRRRRRRSEARRRTDRRRLLVIRGGVIGGLVLVPIVAIAVIIRSLAGQDMRAPGGNAPPAAPQVTVGGQRLVLGGDAAEARAQGFRACSVDESGDVGRMISCRRGGGTLFGVPALEASVLLASRGDFGGDVDMGLLRFKGQRFVFADGKADYDRLAPLLGKAGWVRQPGVGYGTYYRAGVAASLTPRPDYVHGRLTVDIAPVEQGFADSQVEMIREQLARRQDGEQKLQAFLHRMGQ